MFQNPSTKSLEAPLYKPSVGKVQAKVKENSAVTPPSRKVHSTSAHLVDMFHDMLVPQCFAGLEACLKDSSGK